MAKKFIFDDDDVTVQPTAYDQEATLDFKRLRDKPKLSLNKPADWAAMAANDECLIYFPKGGLCVIDELGHEKLYVQRNFAVNDICWSSYLNRFLILTHRNKTLYSLDISSSTIQKLKRINDFTEWMHSCTCYEDTFIVCSDGKGKYIEEYNMTTWKLIKAIELPESPKDNQYIYRIRFNSNGSCLGVIQREGQPGNWMYWFELRDRYTLNILQVTSLHGSFNGLLSLPDAQFLATAWKDKGLLLINSAGQFEQAIPYDAVIDATALINGKCLVIQTTKPEELRFYNL